MLSVLSLVLQLPQLAPSQGPRLPPRASVSWLPERRLPAAAASPWLLMMQHSWPHPLLPPFALAAQALGVAAVGRLAALPRRAVGASLRLGNQAMPLLGVVVQACLQPNRHRHRLSINSAHGQTKLLQAEGSTVQHPPTMHTLVVPCWHLLGVAPRLLRPIALTRRVALCVCRSREGEQARACIQAGKRPDHLYQA